MSTRIRCPHCNSRAVSRTARDLSESVREVYCHCKNVIECGYIWVAHLSAVRTLTPSRIPNPSVNIPMNDRAPPVAAPPSTG